MRRELRQSMDDPRSCAEIPFDKLTTRVQSITSMLVDTFNAGWLKKSTPVTT